MQTQNKILDDLAKVASGAMGTLSGVRQEVEAQLRQQFEKVLDQMEVVSREEFEAVKAMAAKARAEQEALKQRLTILESRVAASSPSRKASQSGGAPAKPRSSKRPRKAAGKPPEAQN